MLATEMKHFIWLTVYLTLFTTENLCGKLNDVPVLPKNECGHNHGYRHETCFPGGGGYHKYTCKTMRTGNVWRLKKTVYCPQDKQSCHCFKVEVGDNFVPKCECYNPLPPPMFPPTGIIRWSGKQRYDSRYYPGRARSRYQQVEGEVHKMSNGRFLLNRTVIGWWNRRDHNQIAGVKILFEIYIPDGDKGFIKYTGKHGNKHCIMRKVKTSRSLSSIWDKGPVFYHQKVYTLDHETPMKGGISNQTWMRYDEDQEGSWRWMWEVEYDSKKEHATPTLFKYQSYDWSDRILYQKTYKYTYEPIIGDNESFRLEEFCSNVKK